MVGLFCVLITKLKGLTFDKNGSPFYNNSILMLFLKYGYSVFALHICLTKYIQSIIIVEGDLLRIARRGVSIHSTKYIAIYV